MRQKIAIFKEGNSVCRGTKNFVRGDVDENRHFIEGKLVVHYQILNIFELVAYGLLFQCRHVDENYHLWKEIGCTWPHFINLIWSGNDAREMTIFKKRHNIWRGTNVLSWGRCSWKSSIYWRKKIAYGQILMSKYYLMMFFCSIEFSRI